MKKLSKVVEYDLIKSISESCPLQPYQFMILRKLPTVEVTVVQEHPDPDNPKNAGLTQDNPKYTFKKVNVKQPAMFQKAVVIKVDDNTAYSQTHPREGFAPPPYSIGDVVIYNERSAMGIDILKGDYIMVRPYDIVGKWDLSKEK
jgi:hypothetical protein